MNKLVKSVDFSDMGLQPVSRNSDMVQRITINKCPCSVFTLSENESTNETNKKTNLFSLHAPQVSVNN